MWWLLRYGDREGRYRTRSEAVMAVILGMVNAGWPEERVYQALTDPRNTAGEKVRDILDSRGELAARRYVRGRYEKAQQRVRVSPPIRDATDARRAIARVEQRADTHRWPGKAGGSARLVLQALLDIAALAGSLAFTASRRQIAEAAGLSRSASDSAISRLVDGRWLRCQRRGRGHLPSSWKVLEHRCGTCCTSGPLETYPFGGREGNGAFAQRLGHDVWRWRGLGKSAWRILGALDTAHGTTAANLAKRLKIDRSTVGRNLVKMADHNLARRDPDGRWRREKEFDLERVAQELGVAGVGDRQRTRHELERSWNWLKLGLRASPWTGEALGDAEAPLPERSSRASATLGVGTG
jgi:hypothetical protein